MTNLQKMFNGDLAAADKWVVDMTNDLICSTCKIQSYCNDWNEGIYSDNMCCMSAYLRWLLEEVKEEPAFSEVAKPVQTLLVHMMCQCGGEFRDTGIGSGSAATALNTMWECKHQHKCDKCGDVQDFDRIYPYIKYEEVDAND